MSIFRLNAICAIFAFALISMLNAQNNINQSLAPAKNTVKHNINEDNSTNKHKEVKIRGNTLVITDASCGTHENTNALNAIRYKDSKHSLKDSDCQTSDH
ncbi:hypothetical protein LS73_004180 [Helicobacter muridarum]|uniref:Periplasmic protein n=1 Tax=Helicobacter muridarum TaxID=216 RepID=A0A099TXE9_9HELI|nr:hypothetical protein [Helicobacter muridarum]TLE00613.1 hypothetical protein LS73_004180 [Helicobacter muridarum]STQ85630.1 Uncharacterised protein [Helicobacter muridarum]